MHFKKALIMLLLLVIMPFNIYAYSEYIYAGGETVGIKVHSSGVLVVGKYDTKNKIDLQVGDIINKIDDKEINTSNDFIEAIKGKKTVSVGYIRGNKEYKTDLTIFFENGIYKSGLYVKDSITGIGTLTFIDPETKLFGALGHERHLWRSATKNSKYK